MMAPCELSFPAPPQTVLDKALGFEVAADRFEVVKEKKAKDFANMK